MPSFEIENRYVHRTGRPVWVRKWVSLLPDEAGKPAHLMALVTDTTGRRQAEQSLRDSEDRFKTLAGSAPAGIFETDTDGNCLFVNDRWCRQAGMTPEAARGLGWAAALHPEDRDRVFRGWHEAAREGREFADEYRFRTPGGTVTWLAGRAVAIRDEAGAVTGYIGTVTDVTERKRAEDALRESEERLRLAVRAAHVGLWDWDLRANATHYSPEWKTLLGHDEAEIGNDFCEWERRIHPDDLAPTLERVRASMAGEEGVYEAEFRMRHKDGSWRWIFARGEFIRDAAGAPVRQLGCHVDITGRKQAEEAVRRSEERLRAILDTAADAVITIDGDGVVQSVNPAAERMFGYAAPEMTGRNVSMLMPSPSREGHNGYLARDRQAGVPHVIGTGREVEARRKDGTVFPVELAVSEVDHLPLFTWIVHDITRRKELERDVVEVVSLEQRRIGQDLHDTVAQELTALSLLAGDLAETLRSDPSGGAELVERMARCLQRSQEQIRAVMRGLLPVAVDAGGLMAALADLADLADRTGETTLLREMYGTLERGDVVLADALFDNYFLVCELRDRGIDLVARAQYQRVGSETVETGPDGDILLWRRPNKPRGMTGEQYRRYPKSLRMRQVSVDARDRDSRAEQFHVITTILDTSIDGGQIGDLYERRWSGEIDIRAIKSTMRMDILRCKTPGMVEKEIWAHLLAYNLLRTVMAVAASGAGIEPRRVSFKGAKQAVTAFAPKIEAARPEDRPALIDALLAVIGYHRVGDRPGRWEPRARKRRPKHNACLTQPRAIAKLRHNRSKWF